MIAFDCYRFCFSYIFSSDPAQNQKHIFKFSKKKKIHFVVVLLVTAESEILIREIFQFN